MPYVQNANDLGNPLGGGGLLHLIQIAQEHHNNAHSSVCYAWPVDLTSHILPQTRLYGRQKSFEGYQGKSFSDGEHKKLFFEVIKELNQKVSNKPIGECMLVGG